MNASSGLWICYSCGRGGTMEMLIGELGDSDADPKLVLRDVRQANLPTKRTKDLPEPEPEEVLAPDPLFIYARFDGFTTPPDRVLETRWIDGDHAAEFAIRWDKGWVIPIWAPDITIPQESLWGWQWKRMSVVLNWPNEVKKSGSLFGLRELGRFGDMSTVAIVESPLDVVRLAMCDVAAVAAFGAYVSKTQQQLLMENADRVLLALDNDKAGHEQADKIYPYLARHVPTAKVIYPDGVKDPGDMTDEQIERTFVDLQGRAVPIPKRRRRHDADPGVLAARTRAGPRKDRHLHRSV